MAPPDTNKVTVTFEDEKGKPVVGDGLTGSYDVTRSVVTVSVPVNLVPSLNGPRAQVAGATETRFLGIRVKGFSREVFPSDFILI